MLAASKSEIQTGERVQLDWRVDGWKKPGFGRNPTKHNVIDLKFLGFVANDGESRSGIAHKQQS